ncbi:MAG: hypothetical protein ABJA57_00395 [Ginsengibacter sp.]
MTKILLYTILLTTLGLTGVAQQDRISVVVNGKKTGDKAVNENATVLYLQISKYRKVSSLALVYMHANGSNVYKRSVEITNEKSGLLFILKETKSKQGWFIANMSTMRKMFAKEKTIRVYLLEDPANDLMALPSRKILLAELHFI